MKVKSLADSSDQALVRDGIDLDMVHFEIVIVMASADEMLVVLAVATCIPYWRMLLSSLYGQAVDVHMALDIHWERSEAVTPVGAPSS